MQFTIHFLLFYTEYCCKVTAKYKKNFFTVLLVNLTKKLPETFIQEVSPSQQHYVLFKWLFFFTLTRLNLSNILQRAPIGKKCCLLGTWWLITSPTQREIKVPLFLLFSNPVAGFDTKCPLSCPVLLRVLAHCFVSFGSLCMMPIKS